MQATIDGTSSTNDSASELRLDGDGNVLVVGMTTNSSSGTDMTVVKLAAADGSELWRQAVDGGSSAGEFGAGLVVDGAGAALACGVTNGSAAFTVMKLDGDGTPNPTRTPTSTLKPTATPTPIQLAPRLLRGRKLLVKDTDGAAERRKLTLLARDESAIVPAPPGSSADPTTGGAELQVTNPSTGQTMTIALPAANWTARSGGYEYSDSSLASGPCKLVSVRPGKLKARCAGSGLSFSLADSPQGVLAVRLRAGGPGAPLDYCMRFGPVYVSRDSAAANGRTGVFKSTAASPPVSCE